MAVNVDVLVQENNKLKAAFVILKERVEVLTQELETAKSQALNDPQDPQAAILAEMKQLEQVVGQASEVVRQFERELSEESVPDPPTGIES